MIRRFLSASLCCLFLLTLSPPPAPASDEPLPSGPTLADHYRQALRIDPDNLTLHYFLGIALLTEERTEEALSEFRLAYPAFVDSMEMNYNLGLAYFRAGDAENALIYFDQAEALGADDHPEIYPLADAYYNLGLSWLEKDSLEEASRLLAKSLALDPARTEIHRMLGDILARRGEIERALEEFAAFLEQHPHDRTAREYVYALHFNRAQEKLEEEDLPAAREHFREALDASPGSPLALYYLGFLDYRQGAHDAAVDRLIPVLRDAQGEVLQSTFAILYNCSLALLEKGMARKAQEAIVPLIESGAAGTREHYLAGNIHLALQERYQAYLRYQDVLKLDPEHRGAAVNLVATAVGAVDELVARGRSHFREGRLRQAVPHFEKALAINPGEPRALSYLKQIDSDIHERSTSLLDAAERYEESGDLRTALETIREALALEPTSSRGAALEERILDTMHQEIEHSVAAAEDLYADNMLTEALERFDRVLELDPGNEAARQGRERIADRRRQVALQANGEGERALEEGRLQDARTAFEEALSLQPELGASREGLAKTSALLASMIDEELQWGRRAMSGGKLGQARKHFRKALALRDDAEIRGELAALDRTLKERTAALFASADGALEDGDVHQARRHFRQVLELVPEHPRAMEGLERVAARSSQMIAQELSTARRHLEEKNFKLALEGFRRVLDIDPANGKARSGLEEGRSGLRDELARLVADGGEALDQGRFDRAEAAFEQALRLDPYAQEARQGIERLEQYKLTGDRPGDEKRLYLRGIELYTSGRYEEAVSTWKRVLFLSPGHERALMNIEKAQRKLRQIQEFHNG